MIQILFCRFCLESVGVEERADFVNRNRDRQQVQNTDRERMVKVERELQGRNKEEWKNGKRQA